MYEEEENIYTSVKRIEKHGTFASLSFFVDTKIRKDIENS